MGMIVGGPRAWKKRQHGNFLVAFHWVNGEGSMCIVNTAVKNCPVFIIGMSMAHEYADSRTGDPTAYAAHKCFEMCIPMGLNKGEAHKLMQVIVEAIPDLLEMPPEPNWQDMKSRPVEDAVASLRQNGKVVMEAPVRLQ